MDQTQADGALGEPSDKSDFSLHVWDSFSQRVIRREPKVECYVLTKVKSPPFVRSFYDDF